MNLMPVMTRRLAFAGLLLPSIALHAQGARVGGPDFRTTRHLGLGYVASVPITPLGFSALIVTPRVFRGAGLYGDVKFTTGSPSSDPTYAPNISIADAEITYADQLFDQKSDWVTIDLALVYALTGDFVVYGGAGYSKETHYRQYYDQSQTRGIFGWYWVPDPDASGTRINALGGGLARLRRFLYFQIGVESEPRAVNLGFTLMLAR